jgi:hypothetical protein
MGKLKTTAILCALLIIAIAALVGFFAMRTRREAKMLINELKDLSVSPSPNDTFDSFQWKYGRSNFKHSDACTFHFCTYELDVSNRDLAKLHLVPYTEMKTWFTVERGQLVLGLVEYRTALKGPNSPVVHVQQGICANGCGVRFDVNPHGTDKQMWNGLVEFNPKAAQSEKDAALAFNLDCFFSFGGCKDIAELLPAVWQHRGNEAVASRFAGLSQRLEESHGGPLPDDF